MRRHLMPVAMLSVALLVAVGCGGGDDDDQPAASPTTTSGNVGEQVDVEGSLDAFDRPDDPGNLGSAPGLPVWFADVGTWGIGAGQAYVTDPEDGRNLAVLGAALGEGGAATVRLNEAVNGAGLVFRYRSPDDFWAVVVVPAYATWAVFRVVEGEEEALANTGLSPIGDGTTVGVRLEGDTVDVLLDGRVARTLVEPPPPGGDRVGLTAQAVEGVAAGEARFEDFRIALPGGGPLPTEAPPPPGVEPDDG